MDEQKVEASMIAARVPQVEPALADAEEFPSLGSQPAAAAPTPAEPNPSTIPSPAQSVPSSFAQVPLTPAALVNIQLYIIATRWYCLQPSCVTWDCTSQHCPSPSPPLAPPAWSQWELASRMTFSQIMSSGGWFFVGMYMEMVYAEWCPVRAGQVRRG